KSVSIDAELKRLANEKSQLQEHVATLEGNKSHLENTLQEQSVRHSQQVQELGEKCETLKNENKVLAEQVSNITMEKDSLERKKDMMTHEIKTIKGDLEEARTNYKKIQDQVEEHKVNIVKFSQDKAKLEETINDLHDKVNEEVSMREVLSGQHAAELAAERQERDQAQAKLLLLKESIAKLQAEQKSQTEAQQSE
ncbi:hypothetical protein OTU49_005196, partial [Cherax quadricarinatus]